MSSSAFSVAPLGYGQVCLAADCRCPKSVPFVQAMGSLRAAANCAAPPSVIANQYAT